MKKQDAGVQNLISEQYYSMLRDAITKHGKLNVRSLARELGIQDGNTYFRHFIENKNQQHLGFSGLSSILERFGYEFKIVIKEKDNTFRNDEIKLLNDRAINDICVKLSNVAAGTKKPEKVEKQTGSKVIQNSDVVMKGIMGGFGNGILLPSDIFGNDDDDDDDLVISYG